VAVLPNANRAIVSSPIGNLSFTPSTGTVTYYEARALAEGTSTPVLATKYLGLPNASPVTNLITVSIRTMLNALPAGSYDVKVAAVGPGGTSLSAQSNVFDVPLS
jgi:hypothetical protein